MALPDLPARTAKEDLSDQAKELNKQLEAARKAMEGMSGKDLPAILEQLANVAKAADKAGPALSGLFKLDPSGARSLRDQFQSVIDKAAEMGQAAKDAAEQAARAAEKAAAKQAKEDEKDRGDNLRGVARGIRNLPSGGIAGLAGGALAAAGPEGEVAAAAFSAATQAIQGAIAAMQGFVESEVAAANPGIWERYQRSVQDIGAVFGQALSPIIEYATQLTDQLNGALSEIAPIVGDIAGEMVSDLKPVIEAFLPILVELFQGFKMIWEQVGPSFKEVMREIAAAIIVTVKAVKSLIDILILMNKGLTFGEAAKVAADLQKAAEQKAKGLAGEKTFAARPAEFGNIEDIASKAQVAAASAGTGAKPVEDSAADIAEKVAAMSAVLAQWGAQFTRMLADLDRIANAIHDPVGAAKDAIANAAAAAIAG